MDFNLMAQDILKVNLPEALVNLDAKGKQEFCDSSLEQKDEHKGIVITFTLSASGKRINDRIYTPKGQVGGLSTWTTPFPKPILVHHEKTGDVLGRVISVDYVDTPNESLKFFKNIRDYNEVRAAFDSDSPKAIHKALHKHGLLTNKAWPGMGRLIAKARITDKDAIEKFLDQRYLTFSAGTGTDRYVCAKCEADWAKHEFCEHTPGAVDEDGSPNVFVTGAFLAREISVVHDPACDLSVVHSIEFSDSANLPDSVVTNIPVDANDLLESVSELDIQWEQHDPRDLAKNLSLIEKLNDALKGETHLERTWLIQIHDALHSRWDWELKYFSSDKKYQIPLDVFKLHGVIHNMSIENDFRNSLMNGELDSYNNEGAPSEEYMLPKPEDSMTLNEIQTLLDKFKVDLTADLTKMLKPVDSDETDDTVLDESIDWYLLDMSLNAELGDAKLSAEKREKLSSKSFCGPDRSFPIPDCAHVTAARRLLGKAKLSSDQKEKVLSCVNKKAKSLACDGDQAVNTVNSDCNCKELRKDYEGALTQIDHLTNELNTLKNSINNNDSRLDSDDKINNNDTTTNVLPTKVDNPGLGATELQPLLNDLGDYEKQVVKHYGSLKATKGQKTADAYLKTQIQRRYIAPTFNINKYILETE